MTHNSIERDGAYDVIHGSPWLVYGCPAALASTATGVDLRVSVALVAAALLWCASKQEKL